MVGSGKEGRILKEDILNHLTGAVSPAATAPLTGMAQHPHQLFSPQEID